MQHSHDDTCSITTAGHTLCSQTQLSCTCQSSTSSSKQHTGLAGTTCFPSPTYTPNEGPTVLCGESGVTSALDLCTSESSCNGSLDPDNSSARAISVAAHSPLGFSDTEGHPADSPKIGADAEDDVPKSTIPVVVREALHQVVKELDAHLGEEDVVKKILQLDARHSRFTDVHVGRDQHYHINITVCPHASSSSDAASNGTETLIINNRDIGPELDSIPTLLRRGIKLVIGATIHMYTMVTNVSAVVSRF